MIKTYEYILGGNLVLDVEVYETAFVPAVIHPVDRCHDAEGGEVEIKAVTVNGEDFDIEPYYLADNVTLEDAIVTAIMEGNCE